MAEMDAILNSMPSSEHLEGTSTESSGKDSYLQLVPAVDQAIRLLFSLANTVGGEASLTQLTKEVGISKSKGLAILNTLRNAGLVTRDDRSKNYSLGPNLLLLSRALINNTDLATAAAPYLGAGRQDPMQRPPGGGGGRDPVRRRAAARSGRGLHPHRRRTSLSGHLGRPRPRLSGESFSRRVGEALGALLYPSGR